MFPFYNFVTRKLYNFVYFDFHMAVKIEIPAMKNLISHPLPKIIVLSVVHTGRSKFIKYDKIWLAQRAKFFQKIREVLDGLFGPNLDKQNQKVCANLTNEEKFSRKIPSFT